MEGQDVDSAALTVDREGRLRDRFPVGARELPGGSLVHRCVAGVQHPIEVTAAPPRDEVQSDLETRGDPGDDGK